MPGLVRKLIIVAAVDGLILQPSAPKHHHHHAAAPQAVRVDYKGNVGPILHIRRADETSLPSIEAHGIIGMLQVAASRFLISISNREQVAQIQGKPIYKITQVALIPISSQSDAGKAISSARNHVKRQNRAQGAESDTSEGESESESEQGAPSVTDSLLEEDVSSASNVSSNASTVQKGETAPKTTVAEDVMQRKGVYGRFADKWFSRKGWSVDNRLLPALRSEDGFCAKSVPQNVDSVVAEQTTGPASPGAIPCDEKNMKESLSPKETLKAISDEKDATTLALLPKVLQTTNMYFSSGNFFFSYDYDLSHGISKQQHSSALPLFKLFDPLFFWNKHIISPFIDAGQHSFVLPIIQGFVGQRAFTIKPEDSHSNSLLVDPTATPDDILLKSWHEKQKEEPTTGVGSGTEESSPSVIKPKEKDFLLTLISRRSTKRAGLRYLRRGVDDDGCTANTVESEQILSTPTWNASQDKIFSFTQLRGSIPLFFSQSPYSLKPQVNTWGSFETNAGAFKRHFIELSSRYGEIHCASLIDKHGNEAKIGELYETHTKAINDYGGIDGKGQKLGFEWFDFHNVCRGMRFENVSQLTDSLEPFMQSTGWVEMVEDKVERNQTGILRTNCMDCLDRTNVVQSACARTALEAQLSTDNYTIDLHHDPSTSWFNTLWADNGDAISRQYAGTAALKGDFTRTRKRQLTGALTDFGLTLTRYYNNIVNDYFTQAVIDYLLGSATDTIFAEFEADMKSSDYFIDVRKVRQQAIDRCVSIVIEDHSEDLLHGWTLSTPTSTSQVKTATFEEAVLLLTNKALYFCRLDWGTEKVKEFERIRLEDVQGVMRGVYITSTLAQRHMDTQRNVGLVIQYRAEARRGLVRRNTRTLDAEANEHSQPEPGLNKSSHPDQTGKESHRFLAFKALPPRAASTSASISTPTPLFPTAPRPAPDNERELVAAICAEIVRAANSVMLPPPQQQQQALNSVDDGEHDDETDKQRHVLAVREQDIISLEEARRTTGFLEQWEYSLKKLVWG